MGENEAKTRLRTLLALCAAIMALAFLWSCGGGGGSAPSASRSKPAVPKGHPRPYKIDGYWYKPLPHARDFSQKGLASWYGKKFHGRKTANGEIYDMYAMTAAHKTLPLGTMVRVCNLNTGKCTEVRVNDRGPFVKGRIIDLSYTAAKKLEVVGPGTAPVRVEAIAAPQSASASDPNVYFKGNFTVQVGAFSNPDNANRLAAKLSKKYKNAHVVPTDLGGQTFHRVRVGKCSSLEQAEQYEKALIKQGFPSAFAVAE